jgi:DNA polymerase III beta subunit
MAALIKTQAGSLVAALVMCALPLGGRQSQRIPALGAVCLAGGSEGLSVTATSFDGTIATGLVDAEAEGEMALPLERLADLARHFPADAELAITADESVATVSSGRARFKLPVFPIAGLLERHPLGEETGRAELDAKAARNLFSRPAFAASIEKSRLYLNGIFLHNVGDNLAAVATDGVRLCRIMAPTTTTLSTDRALIISNELARTIDRLIASVSGNVTLRRSERLFSVEGSGFALVARMIDATYPSYERLIPSEARNAVTASCARLRESLARFAAVADPPEGTHIVKLRWTADGLHLSTPDGSADCLAADVEGETGTAVQIRHLTELIGALRGDSIRISLDAPGGMILVTDPDDENFTALQMPVRSS